MGRRGIYIYERMKVLRFYSISFKSPLNPCCTRSTHSAPNECWPGRRKDVSKLRRISGKIWKSSMIELCKPGDFMHNCAMHELPMLEVQSDASGGALTQPDSIRERTNKDSENPKTD